MGPHQVDHLNWNRIFRSLKTFYTNLSLYIGMVGTARGMLSFLKLSLKYRILIRIFLTPEPIHRVIYRNSHKI